METDRVVDVGVVGKPFGVSGACYVRPVADIEHDFARGTRYATPAGDLVIAHRHDHGDRMVVTFDGVTTRDGAEQLRGVVLRIEASAVELDTESLWADEVVGLEVTDGDGNVLGVVEDLADGPAHDYVIVARPDAAPVWLPAVDALMRIDEGERPGDPSRVVVTPLPGLFEPDEAEAADPETPEPAADPEPPES